LKFTGDLVIGGIVGAAKVTTSSIPSLSKPNNISAKWLTPFGVKVRTPVRGDEYLHPARDITSGIIEKKLFHKQYQCYKVYTINLTHATCKYSVLFMGLLFRCFFFNIKDWEYFAEICVPYDVGLDLCANFQIISLPHVFRIIIFIV
jgi:hypothetical protein